MFPFVIKKAICGEKLRDYVNSLVLFGRMESQRRLVRVPPEGTGEGLAWTEGRMADQTLAQVIVLSYPPLFGLLGLLSRVPILILCQQNFLTQPWLL